MTLNPDKSPGPDGFNEAFFKTFWNIMDKDLVKTIQSIFLEDSLLRQVNTTFVTLIPKIKNPTRLDQFRHISCINTTYKILSKVLTNRVVQVVETLVDNNQTAFLSSRLIGDNYLLTIEMITGFGKTNGRGKHSNKGRPCKVL